MKLSGPAVDTAGGARSDHRDVAAVILAVGVATALNIIVVAVLYDAIISAAPGLSENATQILTGWGGGMLGILGSWIGYRAGAVTAANAVEKPEPQPGGDVADGP